MLKLGFSVVVWEDEKALVTYRNKDLFKICFNPIIHSFEESDLGLCVARCALVVVSPADSNLDSVTESKTIQS